MGRYDSGSLVSLPGLEINTINASLKEAILNLSLHIPSFTAREGLEQEVDVVLCYVEYNSIGKPSNPGDLDLGNLAMAPAISSTVSGTSNFATCSSVS